MVADIPDPAGPSDAVGELEGLIDALRKGRAAVLRGEAPDVVADFLDAAHAHVTNLGRDASQAVGDRLAEALEELEEEARTQFRDIELPPDIAARRLAFLAAEARALRRAARAIEGRPARDETPFLLAQLTSMCSHVQIEDDGGEDADEAVTEDEPSTSESEVEKAAEEVDDLRLGILCTNIERQVDAADQITLPPEEADGDAVRRAFRSVRILRSRFRDLRLHLDAEPHGNVQRGEELLERSRASAQRLETELERFISQSRDPDALKSLEDAASWLGGEIDEARINSLDDARADVERLRGLEADGVRLSRLYARSLKRLAAAGEEAVAAGPSRSRLRRLDRMIRRLRRHISDRILATRLDAVFGRPTVRRWETFILWLIVMVMVLILIDHFWETDDFTPPEMEPERWESMSRSERMSESFRQMREHLPWTVWVDTIICFIFLLDFGVRVVLTPNRLRFIRRHALTEFLPSLPFGILAYANVLPDFRAMRSVRLVRVFRVLRVVRPLIRVVRLVLFVARAFDRLVERNAWLLNQNIVFFTNPVKDESVPTLVKRARDLDAWIDRTSARQLGELVIDGRVEGVRQAVQLIAIEAAHDDGGVAMLQASATDWGRTRVPDRDVDDVVRTLRELDDDQVAEVVGIEFARQVTESLKFLRLPFLRRLPLVHFVLGPSGAPDPLWTTARLGRLGGDLLAAAQKTINWFADLHGIVTGAQFLDRLGMQIMKATSRPAKRLVLFVALFLLALLFVHLIRVRFLIDQADRLTQFLNAPLLVLGGICFIPLAIGWWFRKIAGQAVDFYERIAEAQFLALTETVKEQNEEALIRYLCRRVLLPEARIRGEGVDPAAGNLLVEKLVERLASRAIGIPHEEVPTQIEACGVDWEKSESMMLFYRDFVDGAFLHQNDTKVANMLLGNLTLENVRNERLRYAPQKLRRLDRVDLARGKGGLGGPYVWFNFITRSIAQHVARLVVEYNRHCIPGDEVEAAHTSDRALFSSWLARRQRLSEARARGLVTREENDLPSIDEKGTILYRTTEFNALHFATNDALRDAAVRRRFGNDVADLMIEDRQNLIRDIFGTFPMHELPRAQRTFNPYEFYRRYMARGRVFLFPFVAVWLLLKGIRLLFRQIVKIVKDLLHPESRPLEVNSGHAGFDVARRKIHRMRRPVTMESLRMRAEFDLEYLGLPVPGCEPTVSVEAADDLRQLNASEREWAEFRDLKSTREQQARRFVRVLKRAEERGRSLVDEVVRHNPSLAGRENEVRRAAIVAFACDHEQACSRVEAVEELRDVVARLPRAQAGRRLFSMPAALRRKLIEQVDRCWTLIADDVEADEVERLKRRLVAAASRRNSPIRGHLGTLAASLGAGDDPYVLSFETLVDVGEQPSSWTEQLIAVRSVQALAMLDILGYERLVAKLGGFEDAPDPFAAEPVDDLSAPRL